MNTTLDSDLKKLFTADAFGLIENYFQTLQATLAKEGISSDQINMVTNGIVEFITEYIFGLDESQINFSATLHLIEEIGSPDEIKQSLDNKRSDNLTAVCPHCNVLSIGGAFCEHCGRFIARPSNNSTHQNQLDQNEYISEYFNRTSKQDIIDHPYSRSFIIFTAISYFSFIFYTIVSTLFNINWISLNYSIQLLIEITTYPFFSIFISFFLCLIFGLSINFSFKTKKTRKFQSYDLLEKYDQNSFIGFLLVYLGSTIIFLVVIPLFVFTFYTSLLLNSIEIILLLAIPLANYGYFIYYKRYVDQTQALSLNQLTVLNRTVTKINHFKYIKINLIMILPALALELVILLILPSLLFFLIILAFILIYLTIVNGFLLMKLNSWKTIMSYANN